MVRLTSWGPCETKRERTLVLTTSSFYRFDDRSAHQHPFDVLGIHSGTHPRFLPHLSTHEGAFQKFEVGGRSGEGDALTCFVRRRPRSSTDTEATRTSETDSTRSVLSLTEVQRSHETQLPFLLLSPQPAGSIAPSAQANYGSTNRG